ncbi:MAG: AAA family ATPase [Caldilineales bacterium]
MLIKELKVAGLLSFAPQGIILPLRNLNVFIGPNGSGKSNLLEILALLKAAPVNLPVPMREMGGVREWMWKPRLNGQEASIEAIVNYVGRHFLHHGLVIADHGGRFEVVDEWIENELPNDQHETPYLFYRFARGHPVLNDSPQVRAAQRQLRRENIKPDQSVLSQIRDPERYPALSWLQEQYQQIRLFRNWSFGPTASLRREQNTHERGDFLSDGGDNLPLVLSNILTYVKSELLNSLRKLYDDIEDIHLQINGGNVLLYLEEAKGRQIPATRLSDGTLRYLCLLSILLHPDPPPLIALEEPELGLHPDIIPHIAELLVRASERTQLLVTTHSRMLVDALATDPAHIVVCERINGASNFKRLDPDALRTWLEQYSLGELWSMGQLGGNRW